MTSVNSSTAICDTRRAPKAWTMRELAKLATAMISAIVAKIIGKRRPAPKCSAISCWALLT
ncbi:hypothetical protein ACFSTD_23910 [Novosphingobium colocasiae]